MKKRPPPGATQRARRLRRELTDAERKMWRLLKEYAPEGRWRKQVPIRHFFADFASHRAKVVIEVDGGQHSAEADAGRTALIKAEGYRVLRFWNNEVLGNPEGCAQVLMDALAARSPPSNSG
jgi:very-short-patch-repair endonuclease